MKMKDLQRRIAVAAGREKADLVIRNGSVADVYSGRLIKGDVAIVDGVIAGVGNYKGKKTIDAKGGVIAPGLIDGHLHIESLRLPPDEAGRVCIPHGTTTLIADPHEIANVLGNEGIRYMLRAAKRTPMDIRFMYPSCVPATDFETSGATLAAADMEELLDDPGILGVGEFMDFPGVVEGSKSDLEKIALAHRKGIVIDGHSPMLSGRELNAYAAAGIHDDHECVTVAEMEDRVARGMYVLLRHGSSCHDLEPLIPGITKENARRLVLCTDDKQVNTIFRKGHLEEHLRILRKRGVNPITALQMATINAAECFRLHDRGAVAPGLRADLVIFDNLRNFRVNKVFIQGELVAENGDYLLPLKKESIRPVRGTFRVKDFSAEKLVYRSGRREIPVMELIPGGVLTKKTKARLPVDSKKGVLADPAQDIVKLAVVERHHGTGNVGLAFMKGYGLKGGAIALSVAHDSHNIIAAGADDTDMALAIEEVIRLQGGIVLVKGGKVLHSVALPIAGLMSDRPAEELVPELEKIDKIAFGKLGIRRSIDPVTTLCFMALPVIPELKLTDKGLFDVLKRTFI